jgi:serine/threonine protein phosphatase PrpC
VSSSPFSLPSNFKIQCNCQHPRFDTIFLTALPSQEDFFAIGTAPGPGSKPWNYWSIFDGHAGRRTSSYLQWNMHPILSSALSTLPPTASTTTIHNTMKNVFNNIDNTIMTHARTGANWYPAANMSALLQLAPALSGSCALVAAFDPDKQKLHVACTGDSRAVLGRWDPVEEKYVAQPLSTDQTGFNPAEVARIKEAHPDEDDILDPKSGRLLGLAVTRAFGDHRWKWENDFVKQVQVKFWGTAPRPNSKTPPYLTAEPEVVEMDVVRAPLPPTTTTTTKDGKPVGTEVGVRKSDFMILASDGLWDHMSSEVAIQCVHSWLQARARGSGLVSQDPQLEKPSFSNPSVLDTGVETSEGEVTWQAEPKYFAIEDDNAAVCLARNAMGGSRRNLFVGLLGIPLPCSRNAVDDTTIMVVFFDELGDGKGEGGEKKKEKSSWWPW